MNIWFYNLYKNQSIQNVCLEKKGGKEETSDADIH